MERVPYRDDPAVMEEEWCVPENSELNCEGFLIKNSLETEPAISVDRCEKRWIKQQRQESNQQAEGSAQEPKADAGEL